MKGVFFITMGEIATTTTLNKEHMDDDDEATFLNLSINVKHKVFHASHYDKGNAFPYLIL